MVEILEIVTSEEIAELTEKPHHLVKLCMLRLREAGSLDYAVDMDGGGGGELILLLNRTDADFVIEDILARTPTKGD